MKRSIYYATVLAALGMFALATPGQAAQSCATQMKAVRADLGRAEFGVMKDEAKMQIARAQKAMARQDDAACMTALYQASSFIARSSDDGPSR